MRFIFCLGLFAFHSLSTVHSQNIGIMEASQFPNDDAVVLNLSWAATQQLREFADENPFLHCEDDSCFLFVSEGRFREWEDTSLEWILQLSFQRWGYFSVDSIERPEGIAARIKLQAKPAQQLKRLLFTQGFDPLDPLQFRTPQLQCKKQRYSGWNEKGYRFDSALTDICVFDISDEGIFEPLHN